MKQARSETLHGGRFLAFFAVMLMTVIVTGSALGQSQPVVREIVVEGSQRIEQSTIRSYLAVQEGDRFDPRRIDRSLKSLFATGLFADVTISREGEALVIKVIENPVINQIAFEGNKVVENADLEREISLRPRVVFTRAKVQKDVQRILDLYRINGRFAATVDPKIIQLEQNRADLVFEIDEGIETEVRRIRFVGNRVESDSDLRDIIRTKEEAFFRFFSTDTIYDPDRITLDRELLRRNYLRRGYADFKVNSATAELTPDREAFFITFSVDEGPLYKFGKIDFIAGLRGLEVEELRSVLSFSEGDTYNNIKIDQTIEKLTELIGTQGFAFVEIRPRVNRSRDKKTIDITFDVREGPRVFVEKINISGNVRTLDSVIRHRMELVEGDAFNASKLSRSRRRVNNLNFFSKVDIKRVPGTTPDKAIINVDVEEKSTGALSFGVGFSTDSGPLVDIGLRERNLLGRGQDLSLQTTLAASKSQINLAFTEPAFLDRDVAAGFDIFHKQQDLQTASSHDLQQTGFALRAGYPIVEDVRQNWRYSAEATTIENVDDDASEFIKSQEGRTFLSQVSHGLTLDKRNSSVNTREGFFIRVQNDLAGLGGSVKYFRNELTAAQFYPLTEEWILSLRGTLGHVVGLGQDVRLNDRFFIGGETLRGFQTAGVGPRDRLTLDALGGEVMYRGTVEVKFPIGLPDEFRVNGKLFTDFGSVFEVSPSSPDIIDTAALRAAVGMGVSWQSPFGPIGVDLGFAFLKEDLDKTEALRINFGTRF